MNYKIVCIFFLLIFNFSFAQQPSKELLKSYSKAELKQISANQPNDIEVLNYGIDHAIYFIEVPDGKKVPSQQLKQFKETIRFTDYGIKLLEKTQYFTFADSPKVMAVKSLYHLRLEMNKKP